MCRGHSHCPDGKEVTREDIDHMAAWARVELGMSRAEFNLLLPSEFALVYRKWHEREARFVERQAQLCYVVAVSSGATLKDNKPIPVDFFHPEYAAKQKRKRRPKLLDQFLNAFAGAKVVDLRPNQHGKK